jgi:hypothetical protein
MEFSDAIDAIMPLVMEGSDLPFAITHENGYWNINYFALDENATKAESEVQSSKYLALLRERDPYVVQHSGAEFNGGSFGFVHDDVLRARLRAEYDGEAFEALQGGEFKALVNAFEDNIGRFSQQALDYLLEFNDPLHKLYDMNPIPLYSPDEKYDEDRLDKFFEHIESQIEEKIYKRENEMFERPAAGMSFDRIIAF